MKRKTRPIDWVFRSGSFTFSITRQEKEVEDPTDGGEGGLRSLFFCLEIPNLHVVAACGGPVKKKKTKRKPAMRAKVIRGKRKT